MSDLGSARAVDDDTLHRALRAALKTKRARLHIDWRQLGAPVSPIYDAWDNLGPLLVLSMASLGVLLFWGIAPGIGAMLAVVLFQIFGLRYLVEYRLRGRATTLVAGSVYGLMLLWRYGGLALSTTDPNGPLDACVAPRGDWRRFARMHFPAEGAEGG